MYNRAASICFRHRPRLSYSHVLNDLRIALFRRASSVAEQRSSALQDGDKRDQGLLANKNKRTSSKSPNGDRKILVNDLAATLEAHRASNRASIIRKIHRPPPTYQDWKQLDSITNHAAAHIEAEQDGRNTGEALVKTRAAKILHKRVSRPKINVVRQIDKQVKRHVDAIQRLRNDVYINVMKHDVPPKGQDTLDHQATLPILQKHLSQGSSSLDDAGFKRPWLPYVDSVQTNRLDRSVPSSMFQNSLSDAHIDYPPRSGRSKLICACLLLKKRRLSLSFPTSGLH